MRPLWLLIPGLMLLSCDDARKQTRDNSDDSAAETDADADADSDSDADTDTDTDAEAVRQADCSGMDPADRAPLGGWIALTFDDGPYASVTPQILAILREHEVPATFFMVGEMIVDPAHDLLVQEIVDDPLFQVANHSWDHAFLPDLSMSEVRGEIEGPNEALAAYGADPLFFRFPYGGATCEQVRLVREEYGMRVTGWHIDTGDWCYSALGEYGECVQEDYFRIPDGYEDDMFGWTMEQVGRFDGGIFLYHDLHRYTADSLEDVILAAQAAGYTFTRLDNAEAFPNLNAGEPFDFPWIGEECSLSDDTCWQIEYQSWCEPVGDPELSSDIGVCVFSCEGEGRCIDRDGVAPLACVETPTGAGRCLALSHSINEHCAAVPGTVARTVARYDGGADATVCVPLGWGE